MCLPRRLRAIVRPVPGRSGADKRRFDHCGAGPGLDGTAVQTPLHDAT